LQQLQQQQKDLQQHLPSVERQSTYQSSEMADPSGKVWSIRCWPDVYELCS